MYFLVFLLLQENHVQEKKISIFIGEGLDDGENHIESMDIIYKSKGNILKIYAGLIS